MANLRMSLFFSFGSASALTALLPVPFPLLGEPASSTQTITPLTVSVRQEKPEGKTTENTTEVPREAPVKAPAGPENERQRAKDALLPIDPSEQRIKLAAGITMPDRLAELSTIKKPRGEPEDAAPLIMPITEGDSKPDSDQEQARLAEQPSTIAEDKPEPEVISKKPIIGTAVRLSVPSISIDIAVRAGSYDPATATWTLGDDAAFHADTTVPVNDTNGTTLIYGHAKWGLFGTLPDLSEGAEAIVDTTEGTKFIYTLTSVREIAPTDVGMLTVEGAPQLLLQTCSGAFNQRRIVASFQLKEVLGKEVVPAA